MTLQKKIFIEGIIHIKTGIRIGGSSSTMSIGGVDSIVIRNPLNNQPYIPGSSLKGKMRSLLEQKRGEAGGAVGKNIQAGSSDDPESLSSKIFGISINDKDNKDKQHPSRLIVRDAILLHAEDESKFKNCDTPFAEVKAEVTICRVTARAMPRFIERVPAGAEFQFQFIVNIFNGEDESTLMGGIFTSLELIQDDYLGGGGSRGNGQVDFEIQKIYEKNNDYYSNKITEATCLKGSYDTAIQKFSNH